MAGIMGGPPRGAAPILTIPSCVSQVASSPRPAACLDQAASGWPLEAAMSITELFYILVYGQDGSVARGLVSTRKPEPTGMRPPIAH
jgi:hypothetical protein